MLFTSVGQPRLSTQSPAPLEYTFVTFQSLRNFTKSATFRKALHNFSRRSRLSPVRTEVEEGFPGTPPNRVTPGNGEFFNRLSNSPNCLLAHSSLLNHFFTAASILPLNSWTPQIELTTRNSGFLAEISPRRPCALLHLPCPVRD